MGNIETVPSQPMDSSYAKPRQTFAKIKAKPKCKVKVVAKKARTVKKPISAALKRVTKNKAKCVKRSVKPKEIELRNPSKTGFQQFYKDLREFNPAISESEILKKAAIVWCNMNEGQRRRFLQ